MKKAAPVCIVVALLVAASCATWDDPPATPSSVPAGPRAATVADVQEAIGTSDQAFEAAEKACRGCPDGKVCEQALAAALQAMTAALQSAASGSDRPERRAAQSDSIDERFDALAELANECL